MSDIATVANHIVIPKATEPVKADANPATPRATNTDANRPLEPQNRPNTARQAEEEATSANKTGQAGAENFRDVLERRLAKKTDDQPQTEETKAAHNQDPGQPATKEKSTPNKKPARLVRLANAEPGTPLAQLQAQAQPAETEAGLKMPSENVVTALPAKETAEQTQVKTSGNVASQINATTTAKSTPPNLAKGQPVETEEIKTENQPSANQMTTPTQNAKTDTPTADVTGALKDKPAAQTVKTQNAFVENKNTTAANTQQTKVPAAENNTKPTADPQPEITQAKDSDILDQIPKQDSPPQPDIPVQLRATKVAIAATNSAPVTQTNTKPTQTAAPAKTENSTAAKETSDAMGALAAARTNAVVAETVSTNPTTTEATAPGLKAVSSPAAITPGQSNPANPATSSTAGADSAQNMNMNISINPAEQIIESVRLNVDLAGPQQINISLNPPELGKVRIVFQHIDGEITGILEAEKRQTRYEIEEALPEIVASLQGSGVPVKRINVVLDEPGQQPQPQNKNNNEVPQEDFNEMTKQGSADQSSAGGRDGTNSAQTQNTEPVPQKIENTNPKIIKEITDKTINVYV
ncbi:MAG: flagellar hook-length control protein FliK [Planctomycetota bacterium]|jgi:flagellar hook-length control protein FliK